jgi:hypothetical protein
MDEDNMEDGEDYRRGQGFLQTTLTAKIENQTYVKRVKTVGDFILVCDIMKSLTVYKLVKDSRKYKLELVARDPRG